ncbi:histidine kinase [uncultured Flavobacterium sp.]|uniref:sensor histidine kinase n=1 Tax=uncultured Flavobacterium sp. TaxID=165435 RepID=UPI0030EC2F26|tara:strand:+ start:119217 stop:120263 length:1047 start_codon:yes stop_codon:yes gene_type:complete
MYKTILLHFLFWIGVWFFFVYFFSYNSDDTYYITWFSSLLLPIALTTTYITIYFLIPKYLLTKRYFKLGLYSFYTIVLSVYLSILAVYGSFIFITKLDITKVPPMGKNFVFILILVYLIVGIVSFIYLLKHNFNAQTKYKALENKILETNLQIKEQELYYLKKQIHPHFLFNTLNTIYGFALKKSEFTPELILKLSNLLDYILYQVQKPKVLLSEEIEHINEYIDLEKIRFEDRLKVKFSYPKIMENIEIAPMLLIPFIENAFKHGNIINGFLTIYINLSLTENNQLLFGIKNSFLNNNIAETTGIGLENIRKRLELLFPNKYDLKTELKENYFEVSLVINEIKPIDE